jgi:hypothetical protein
MPGKALVMDANILVRAVLGRRVREIIVTYVEQASFFVPDVAYAEAEEDWPILASALAIGCPIWTEDTDFFGCGVPTWTTNRVVMFLREPQK